MSHPAVAANFNFLPNELNFAAETIKGRKLFKGGNYFWKYDFPIHLIFKVFSNSKNSFTHRTTSHPREGFYFFDDLVCYMYTTTATVMPHTCAKRQKLAKN